MALWNWFKGKVYGDPVKDYGRVLEWEEAGTRYTLELELRARGDDFRLVAKTTSSGFLSRYAGFSRVKITPEVSRQWEELARDLGSAMRDHAQGEASRSG